MWEKSERMNQYVGWNMNIFLRLFYGGILTAGLHDFFTTFPLTIVVLVHRRLSGGIITPPVLISTQRMNEHTHESFITVTPICSIRQWLNVGRGIKTKSGSYREFRLSYFKLACKSVCKQPLVVRPECLSVCYGEDLRRAGSFLKCAY